MTDQGHTLVNGDVVVELEVIWFPPEKKQRRRKVKDMEEARRICQVVDGFTPLIQRREIIYGDWVVIENLALNGKRIDI